MDKLGFGGFYAKEMGKNGGADFGHNIFNNISRTCRIINIYKLKKFIKK